jgi:hypothetical protein
MSAGSTPFREPTEAERRLLSVLFSKCNECSPEWLTNLLVSSMDDGGMGSLRLRLKSEVDADPKLGRRAAEVQFADADGITVIASLNLSTKGLPFEMDIWKTDFSPLTRVPQFKRDDAE